MEKISGGPNWVRNEDFCRFLRVASYFLDIAQDCSLRQCLTSSRAEISEKTYGDRNWGRKIFSILMFSTVHSKLLS